MPGGPERASAAWPAEGQAPGQAPGRASALQQLARISGVTLSAGLLAACGGGAADEPQAFPRPLAAAAATAPAPATAGASQGTLTLYRYAGSLQCEGGGVSLVALERQLSNAGVMALSLACGNDGRYYPSTCGTPDGRILMAEVPATQADAARGAGMQSITGLVSAVRTACE